MRWIVWGLGCGVAAAVAAFVIGMALPEFVAISQHEGAYAMGVAFFWTPAAFVLGLVAGLIIAARRR